MTIILKANGIIINVSTIRETPEESQDTDEPSRLPTKALFLLSQSVQALLKKWNFSGTEQVHFDTKTNDFVLNGKHRASNGKGHRAITNAAAILGLLKYCENYKFANLGFVVLDSPLLAYEKPENDEENLSETDLNEKFLENLKGWTSKQIIVFENKKSIPNNFSTGHQIEHFTKNELIGRYGFFPI